MTYKLADQVMGPFGQVYDTFDVAKSALDECVKDGQRINDKTTSFGMLISDASDFFYIVNIETGEEIRTRSKGNETIRN